MAARFDLAWDSKDTDLDISSGDIALTPSDENHIKDTMRAFPGWWKQYPLDGVGIGQYYGGPNRAQLIQKEVRLNLTNDGYSVNNPSVIYDNAGGLTVNPNATI